MLVLRLRAALYDSQDPVARNRGAAMALSAGHIHNPSRSLLENRLQTVSYAAR
jgi:hypothetical protein